LRLSAPGQLGKLGFVDALVTADGETIAQRG
jgi:hypothetical protein